MATQEQVAGLVVTQEQVAGLVATQEQVVETGDVVTRAQVLLTSVPRTSVNQQSVSNAARMSHRVYGVCVTSPKTTCAAIDRTVWEAASN